MTKYRIVYNGIKYRIQYLGKSFPLRRPKWRWIRCYLYAGDWVAEFDARTEADIALAKIKRDELAKLNGFKTVHNTRVVENKWFCTKCSRVFQVSRPNCCGKVVVFNLLKHGESLIGLSNSWIAVSSHWEKDPLLDAVTGDCIKDGCYSSAVIFNEFVQKLKDQIEDD